MRNSTSSHGHCRRHSLRGLVLLVWFTLLVAGLVCPSFAGSTAEVRSIDGTGNNLNQPTWGSTDTALSRVAPAAYAGDGSGDAIGALPHRPSARTISNAIVAQNGAILNDRDMSHYVWQWGQFLDHDIGLTPHGPTNGSAPIAVQSAHDPLAPGPIAFDRSAYVDGTGDSPGNPRQQKNVITTWIDASQVYGSDHALANELRQHSHGRLKTGAHDLLPPDPQGGSPGRPVPMIAGDERANEQLALTAMHTVFMREHNRLADEIAARYPDADDEAIYQAARRIVGAEIQHITYAEFLPALMGDDAPRANDYAYDDAIDPSLRNSFSTALFRFGHSLVPHELPLVNHAGDTERRLRLHEAFFRPAFLRDKPHHVDQILRGLAAERASALDTKVVTDLRNLLFGAPGGGGLDLAALNIQRGRDHGLPDYNTVRAAHGLDRVDSFAEITSDPSLQRALANVYNGDVDNIDAWVGALAEDHQPGSSLGELLTAALREQFIRLRDGDRFFYTGDELLSESEWQRVIDLDSLRLSDVIRWNTDIEHLPNDVFFVHDDRMTVVPAPSAFAVGAVLMGAVLVLRGDGWKKARGSAC